MAKTKEFKITEEITQNTAFGYTAIKTAAKGKYILAKKKENGCRFAISSTIRSFVEYPVLYHDGKVGYDNPERIPASVRKTFENEMKRRCRR